MLYKMLIDKINGDSEDMHRIMVKKLRHLNIKSEGITYMSEANIEYIIANLNSTNHSRAKKALELLHLIPLPSEDETIADFSKLITVQVAVDGTINHSDAILIREALDLNLTVRMERTLSTSLLT